MDHQRHSGAYAPSSSQYYDNDHRNDNQAPLTDRRQSFSTRVGKVTGALHSPEEPHYTGSEQHDSRPVKGGRRGREPLAALHAPKPHPTLDTSMRDPRRSGLSPTSPLSPLENSGMHGQRRGSVPDRSPLQKLEGKLDDISKEEKRARVEEAEHRARERERERAGANQSRRVDTHPPALAPLLPLPLNQDLSPASSGYPTQGRRHVSAPLPTSKPNGQYDHRNSVDIGGKPFKPNRSANVPMQSAQAIDAGHKFGRASDALRMQNQEGLSGDIDRPHRVEDHAHRRTSRDASTAHNQESDSTKYRHRLRDAGSAAATTAAASSPVDDSGLDGTKKRNDSKVLSEQRRTNPLLTFGRADSKKLQKKSAPHETTTGDRGWNQSYSGQDLGRSGSKRAAGTRHEVPERSPLGEAQGPNVQGPTYQGRSYATAGHNEPLRYNGASQGPPPAPVSFADHHHRFGGLFHGHNSQARTYRQGLASEEWRNAGIAKLTLEDMVLDDSRIDPPPDTGKAWWEKASTSQRRESRSAGPGPYDGPYEEDAQAFQPSLLLKCGPLLRYTGMRREKNSNYDRNGKANREVWRGSVMIVTLDSHSSYESAPTLRLFSQPMDLLPPQPSDLGREPQGLLSEYDDPIAGQVKVSRTGKPLFVRPVDELEEGVDASRVEDDSGLFESTKTIKLVPQQVGHSSGQRNQHITTQNSSRIKRRDGERAGKYREVKAARLHAERGVTFWRFNIEVELGPLQTRVAYRINRGPAVGLWVPARGESMNIMFHSCNGFSLSVDPNLFSGPDPLWRDVLNKHQSKPFHVMLGGGDQIYNDAATRDTKLFRDWLLTKNPEHKLRAEFTEDMQNELESFYLNRYSMWFSQGLFGMANAQIPMVNIYDDHDIIDGFGSYPHHFMSTKVFTGLGAVAFKYYLLFQHQSVVSESQREEPSWLIGASPGPYIKECSRSVFMSLGRKVAFLGLDCRTERMRDEILSQESYDIIFDRCRAEIIKGETKHLIVLLGVPIAYPRLNFLENILTSRVMDPIKAIGRTGVLGGFVNKFDGGVEILDDLDDHWTAKHHKAERNWFIQELQELAAEKSVRVTILGGDVHLGAVGQFYTKKKLGVSKDRDHRYMPNVISSAIVNTPPPTLMGDVLNKRNKIHHLDTETDEDMIPMFEHDVDGKSRNNLHLLPRRNYCTIREYIPGSTPPPSPRPATRDSTWSQSQDNESTPQRYPPGSMKRTLSLSGGTFRPGNLVRRLSGSRTRAPASATRDHPGQHDDRPSVFAQNHHEVNGTQPESGRAPPGEVTGSYFPPQSTRSNGVPNAGPSNARPIGAFHRRPTNLSEKAALKAAARGGAEGNIEGQEQGHINLEGGLDIALNMEVDQRDPAGTTMPYRLLVPALWYEGPGDLNPVALKSKGPSLMDRLRGRGKQHGIEDDYSGSESELSSSSVARHSGDRHTHSSQPAYPRYQNARANNDATISAGRSYDGANDSYNEELRPPPSSRHPTVTANKEYSASSPQPSAPHPSQLRGTDEPRRSGVFGFRRHNSTTDTYSESDEDGSLTESDIDSLEYEQQQQRQRRPSKTDKFFGIGNDRNGAGGRRDSTIDGPPIVEQSAGKRKGWRLWK